MKEQKNTDISPLRLRIGFLFIFLWWAPFWALGPALADITGLSESMATLLIMGVQTAIGFIGLAVVGKTVSPIFKKAKFKQALGIIWHALIFGKLPGQV